LAGRDQLTLAYLRPWTKGVEPARALKLDVVIRDPGLRGNPGKAVTPSGVLIGRYVGKLPCADCSEIQESLALYAPGKDQFINTYYVDSMTYQGGRNGNQSNVTAGKWFVRHGTPADPNATIYSLSVDSTDRTQNYLLSGDSLVPLDDKLHPIQGPWNMSLRRVP
jgi:hypothetical protein